VIRRDELLAWAGDIRLPDGVHRNRRVADVAVSDSILDEGVYLRVRARRPRPSWSEDVAVAVTVVALHLDRIATDQEQAA
jgi:hypothetical protein